MGLTLLWMLLPYKGSLTPSETSVFSLGMPSRDCISLYRCDRVFTAFQECSLLQTTDYVVEVGTGFGSIVTRHQPGGDAFHAADAFRHSINRGT